MTRAAGPPRDGTARVADRGVWTAEDSAFTADETRPIGYEPVGEGQETRSVHDVVDVIGEPARSLA